jgi:hypothetical protein
LDPLEVLALCLGDLNRPRLFSRLKLLKPVGRSLERSLEFLSLELDLPRAWRSGQLALVCRPGELILSNFLKQLLHVGDYGILMVCHKVV